MRRAMLFLSLVALLIVAAFPVLAQDRNDRDNDRGDRFDNGGFFFASDDDDDNGFFFDNDDGDFDFDGSDFEGSDFDSSGVSQSIGQESESGDVAIEGSVSSEGDFAQQCVAPLQFGNTGNLQNAQGFLQYGSESDDVEFEGSEFVFEPAIETTCDQAVQQSSAASSF